MRLAWQPVAPVRVPAVPAASVALLLLAVFSVAEMQSAVRGVGLEFPPSTQSATPLPDDAPAVLVGVDREGTIRVDGAVVPRHRLIAAVRLSLAREPAALVVLFVVPEAPYALMADVAGLLRSGEDDEGERLHLDRLSIPTHRQVADYVAAHGSNPFEDTR